MYAVAERESMMRSGGRLLLLSAHVAIRAFPPSTGVMAYRDHVLLTRSQSTTSALSHLYSSQCIPLIHLSHPWYVPPLPHRPCDLADQLYRTASSSTRLCDNQRICLHCQISVSKPCFRSGRISIRRHSGALRHEGRIQQQCQRRSEDH